MNVLVSYSRPRGKYGRYVFTVMIYFSHPTETATIEVRRSKTTYSCNYCGQWAKISTYTSFSPSEHRKIGTIELYRYDNVEPGDYMSLKLIDTELIWCQGEWITIAQNEVKTHTGCSPSRSNPALKWDGRPIYEVNLLDWDAYMSENAGSMELRVEEELIRQTMNAEKITITKLLLEPKGQPLEIERQKRFIEAELRYME